MEVSVMLKYIVKSIIIKIISLKNNGLHRKISKTKNNIKIKIRANKYKFHKRRLENMLVPPQVFTLKISCSDSIAALKISQWTTTSTKIPVSF
jgi:hypothetical protein